MKEQIKQFAKELHISDLGVCEARIYTELYDIPAQQSTPFTPPPEKRLSPFDFVPDAKSVIMCAFNYFNGNISGNISKYARGTDYHTVVKNKLAALCEKIEAVHGAFSHYIFCDDSPLCDKYLAYLSGLGVFGRNHLLIHPTYGSYIFIGGIVTSLALAPDKPLPGGCAGCGRCAAACPGNAFKNGFDASRCASYLLQKRGQLQPKEEHIVRRAGMAWGCDICSDVCPHNQAVPMTDIDEFHAKIYNMQNEQLLGDKAFRDNFEGYAFSWRGRAVLHRNVKLLED